MADTNRCAHRRNSPDYVAYRLVRDGVHASATRSYEWSFCVQPIYWYLPGLCRGVSLNSRRDRRRLWSTSAHRRRCRLPDIIGRRRHLRAINERVLFGAIGELRQAAGHPVSRSGTS